MEERDKKINEDDEFMVSKKRPRKSGARKPKKATRRKKPRKRIAPKRLLKRIFG